MKSLNNSKANNKYFINVFSFGLFTDISQKTPTHQKNTLGKLAYYINGINNVFKGGTLDIKDQFSFDFPPIQSQQEWDDFLQKFWNDAEEFASLIEQMPDEKLNEDFVNPKYGTYLRNIDGMIEHSYYHLGQISLIKKLLNNK